MKYEKDKITVIIPVYNVENYLERCLKAVLYNTYTNLEIICVNDGSTDNSKKILEDYSQRDKRVIVINKKIMEFRQLEMQELKLLQVNI